MDALQLHVQKLLLGSSQGSRTFKKGGSAGPSDCSGVALSGPAVVSAGPAVEEAFLINLRARDRNVKKKET